jgi:hypothetical protein
MLSFAVFAVFALVSFGVEVNAQNLSLTSVLWQTSEVINGSETNQEVTHQKSQKRKH